MAVALALLVVFGDVYSPLVEFRDSLTAGITPKFWLSLIVYPLLVYLLVWLPISKMREGETPSAKSE